MSEHHVFRSECEFRDNPIKLNNENNMDKIGSERHYNILVLELNKFWRNSRKGAQHIFIICIRENISKQIIL